MDYRCTIWKKQKDGLYSGISCNYGGEFSVAGRILLMNYSTEEMVDRLIDLGFLSSIGPTLNECVAYGRDRGELKRMFLNYSIKQADYIVYTRSPKFKYCWIDGRWYWGLSNLSPLLDTCIKETTK
jgi:hypothetical protein